MTNQPFPASRARVAAATVFLALTSTASAAPQGALPPPPTPPQNPTTAEKAVLGKMLFWDEQLSSDGTIACGTCHQPSHGGADARITNTATHPGPDGIMGTDDDIHGSPGVHRGNSLGQFTADPTFGFGVQSTNRNTPSMIAAAYFQELFWDGRATSQFNDPVSGALIIPQGGALESQSLDPIISDVEMANEGRTWPEVTAKIAGMRPMALATNLTSDMTAALAVDATYPELFEAAFGTTDVTPVRIAFALAAYQRTLVPDESKFDRVMRNQANFTLAENRGRAAFNSPQSRCDECHSGTLFSDDEFHNLGLRPVMEDDGRRSVTGEFLHRGQFKTPSLRNVALRTRFFHTGGDNVDNLLEVLNFYNDEGGDFTNNKDQLLDNLRVPNNVRGDIIAFLNTLTDPRVANETAPFDRPTLWSERTLGNRNPLPMGFGAEAGTGGFLPQIVATSPPKEGNSGFRVGGYNMLGDTFAVLRVNLQNIPAGATTMDLRNGLPFAQTTSGVGADGGFITWSDEEALVPVLVGLSYEAQWWIRDFGVPTGVAKSDWVRITVE